MQENIAKKTAELVVQLNEVAGEPAPSGEGLDIVLGHCLTNRTQKCQPPQNGPF